MELLSLLNSSSLECIPLLELEDKLINLSSTSNGMLLVNQGERQKVIKCIREYYLSPDTKKKVPKVNLVNPCVAIHGAFYVDSCASVDCKNCHLKMIEKYFNGEAFLIKNNKK